jgi:hypothetical protein
VAGCGRFGVTGSITGRLRPKSESLRISNRGSVYTPRRFDDALRERTCLSKIAHMLQRRRRRNSALAIIEFPAAGKADAIGPVINGENTAQLAMTATKYKLNEPLQGPHDRPARRRRSQLAAQLIEMSSAAVARGSVGSVRSVVLRTDNVAIFVIVNLNLSNRRCVQEI